MALIFAEDPTESLDPMDVVEAVVSHDDRFSTERLEDGDLSFAARGAWCEVSGFFSWREELPALMLTVSFDLRAPKSRFNEAARLVALINEHLWLGHFDIWADDGSIVYRHALPMVGRSEIAIGEIQALLAAAIDSADRFYPAFNLLFWAGKSPEEAVEVSMFDTVGEA